MDIGLRIPGNKLSQLEPEALVAWVKEAGLDAIDLPMPDPALKSAADQAGIRIGTTDISGIGDSLSVDEKARNRAVASIKEQLHAASDLGIKTIFACLVPADHTIPRRETFAIFSETYPEIVAHAESLGLSIALEPWPGPVPHFPTIGCTPEMYRAIFDKIPSSALGICYDPSHYVRLGIDYLRLLEEFGDRVRHVHGKDTEILWEGRYLHGTLGETFPGKIGWAGGDWRYCIPGAGEVNWSKVFAHLRMIGYDGVVSIELEDHVYGHTLEGSKQGVVKAAEHLRSAM